MLLANGLQTAVTRLRERLEEVKAQEEDQRRQLAYDKARVLRDHLAVELADLYPAVAQKLADLAARVAANDFDINFINDHNLPNGARAPADGRALVARGLPGWVTNGIYAPRIIDLLHLPPWHPRSSYFWPPGMK